MFLNQFWLRTTSPSTPPSWTPTSTWSARTPPASRTSGSLSLSTTRASRAPASRRKRVSGIAETASGRTSTSTAQARQLRLSSEVRASQLGNTAADGRLTHSMFQKSHGKKIIRVPSNVSETFIKICKKKKPSNKHIFLFGSLILHWKCLKKNNNLNLKHSFELFFSFKSFFVSILSSISKSFVSFKSFQFQ